MASQLVPVGAKNTEEDKNTAVDHVHRPHLSLTPVQLEQLRAALAEGGGTMTTAKRREMAQTLGVTLPQITRWINNRKRQGPTWKKVPYRIHRYTEAQRELLKQTFATSHFVSKERVREIAKETGFDEYRIRLWFRNERHRWRADRNLINKTHGCTMTAN